MNIKNEVFEWRLNPLFLFVLQVVVILFYASAISLLANITQTPFNNVLIFSDHFVFHPTLVFLKIIAFISAVFIFVVTGIIWGSVFRTDFKSFTIFWGFVIIISLMSSILGCIVFQLFRFPGGMTRANFLIVKIILNIIGTVVLFFRSKNRKLKIKSSADLFVVGLNSAAIILLVSVVLFSFWGKFFHEYLSFDGEENYNITTSLTNNFFPEMGFEHADTDERCLCFGLKGESSVFAVYTTFFASLMFGQSYVPIRLLYILVIVFLYLMIVQIVSPSSKAGRFLVSMAVVSQIVLYTIIMFFYVADNQFFVDICAEPLQLTLFSLLVISVIYFLLKREKNLFVLYLIALCFTKILGFVMGLFILLT